LDQLEERFSRFRKEQDKTIKEITEELNLPKTALYNFTRTGKLKYIHQVTLTEYLSKYGY